MRGGDHRPADDEVRHGELHGAGAGREVGVHDEGGDVGVWGAGRTEHVDGVLLYELIVGITAEQESARREKG